VKISECCSLLFYLEIRSSQIWLGCNLQLRPQQNLIAPFPKMAQLLFSRETQGLGPRSEFSRIKRGRALPSIPISYLNNPPHFRSTCRSSRTFLKSFLFPSGYTHLEPFSKHFSFLPLHSSRTFLKSFLSPSGYTHLEPFSKHFSFLPVTLMASNKKLTVPSSSLSFANLAIPCPSRFRRFGKKNQSPYESLEIE
jgi:hypothetical protein